MKLCQKLISNQNNIEIITSKLNTIGYTDIKNISTRRVAVLTNKNRIDVLRDIETKLSDAIYDKSPKSDSSAGRIICNGITILAKPASKQGKASAGISNEYAFVSGINSIIQNGPIDVVLDDGNKKIKIYGCTRAEPVGADTKCRKKADVILKDIAGNSYPISIKKSNAETWESADSYFSQEASQIIDRAINQKQVELKQIGDVYQIYPNLAVEATAQEKHDAIFGSDITNRGAIVTGDFSSHSFNLANKTLIISCNHIATDLCDIENTCKDVFFLIRNDKTRRSIQNYPGIRVLAVYKKRINQNVKVLNRK